jgi:hypothetical protein
MAKEEDNMKTGVRLVLAAALSLGGVGLAGESASALPMSGLAPALVKAGGAAAPVEDVRRICGPYGGCRWAPGWRYWGPPRPWGPYGFYRPWRRHYGWGGYYRHYW